MFITKPYRLHSYYYVLHRGYLFKSILSENNIKKTILPVLEIMLQSMLRKRLICKIELFKKVWYLCKLFCDLTYNIKDSASGMI